MEKSDGRFAPKREQAPSPQVFIRRLQILFRLPIQFPQNQSVVQGVAACTNG
jgi:hypothetical protein